MFEDEEEQSFIDYVPIPNQPPIPLGFNLSPLPYSSTSSSSSSPSSSSSSSSSSSDESSPQVEDLLLPSTHLRFRGRDRRKVKAIVRSIVEEDSGHYKVVDDVKVRVREVYFPLLSLLIHKWKKSTLSSFSNLILLVSGVGVPRDPQHNPEGNSTQSLAELCLFFLSKAYEARYFSVEEPFLDQQESPMSQLSVAHLHSSSNLFKYDENISFVRNSLLPHVNEIRNVREGFESFILIISF